MAEHSLPAEVIAAADAVAEVVGSRPMILSLAKAAYSSGRFDGVLSAVASEYAAKEERAR